MNARHLACGRSLVVRYLLDTCATVAEALGRLRTIPISTAQNLTLADPRGAVTVYAGPDIPLTETPDACAADHHWPGERWEQSFDRFPTVARTVALGTVGRVRAVAPLR